MRQHKAFLHRMLKSIWLFHICFASFFFFFSSNRRNNIILILITHMEELKIRCVYIAKWARMRYFTFTRLSLTYIGGSVLKSLFCFVWLFNFILKKKNKKQNQHNISCSMKLTVLISNIDICMLNALDFNWMSNLICYWIVADCNLFVIERVKENFKINCNEILMYESAVIAITTIRKKKKQKRKN